jgi:hypothetical protein
MITFYNSEDKPQGTLELVDGELQATGMAELIVGPPEDRQSRDEDLYKYYAAWSNGYYYSKEDKKPSK